RRAVQMLFPFMKGRKPDTSSPEIILDAEKNILSGLPADLILRSYMSAPGDEIRSGKFHHPESSAALVANTFGYFLQRPRKLPEMIGAWNSQPFSVRLEATVWFPWTAGRHPCLDVLVETDNEFIGVESKRYEPFREQKNPHFSSAYFRKIWGERMTPYESIRD